MMRNNNKIGLFIEGFRNITEKMIYLHTDKRYRPDQWYRRFEYLLTRRGLPYRKVDLERTRPYRLRPGSNDALVGRLGHRPKELQRIRPVFDELTQKFSGRIFPSPAAYYYYDDKQRQLDMFSEHGFPTPRSASVASRADVERFLDQTGLRFPLVTKRTHGASSSQVRLAQRWDDLFLPGVVQEFCRDNDGDYRIVVIGHRVMGFFRQNRPGDFRASGSGLIAYRVTLDPECVKIAYEISRRMQFECMAYDFVRDNRGRWVVLECSYCFVDAAVRDCGYYDDMQSGERRDKTGVYPQDFILEDFLAKYPDTTKDAAPCYRFRLGTFGHGFAEWLTRLGRAKSLISGRS